MLKLYPSTRMRHRWLAEALQKAYECVWYNIWILRLHMFYIIISTFIYIYIDIFVYCFIHNTVEFLYLSGPCPILLVSSYFWFQQSWVGFLSHADKNWISSFGIIFSFIQFSYLIWSHRYLFHGLGKLDDFVDVEIALTEFNDIRSVSNGYIHSQDPRLSPQDVVEIEGNTDDAKWNQYHPQEANHWVGKKTTVWESLMILVK